MTLAKVKEQDGMMLAKVKVPSIPTLSGLIAVMTCNKCGIHFLYRGLNCFIRLCPPLQAADVVILGTFTLQALFHLVPLLLQASSHLVPLLLQASSHLVPLLFTAFHGHGHGLLFTVTALSSSAQSAGDGVVFHVLLI